MIFSSCRLLEHLSTFIKACTESEGELCSCIGSLLCVIFKGEPSIALSVKERDIVAMMTMLLDKESLCSDPAILCGLIELLTVC